MNKRLTCIVLLLLILFPVFSFCQEGPNVSDATQMSPNSSAAGKMINTEVNYFTGTPSVSLPLYSYTDHNGLGLKISAEFSSGGIRDGETPSLIGMGWYLNLGNVITRQVRGVPDDMATYGFMYSAAIPADYRVNGNKYYFDSLDAQQDIFQFNVNGQSGKFFIGKNKQIIQIPASKTKIEYTTVSANADIATFKITTPDGVCFIFNDIEQTTTAMAGGTHYAKSQYSGHQHGSAWYPTYIVSPFKTDTIRFNYTTKSLTTQYSYPQVVYVKNSDHTVAVTYNATGYNTSTIKKLNSISFPDKQKVDFVYSYKYQYDDTDYALAKLKVSDTIFRYGYAFDYQTSWSGKIVPDPNADVDQPDSVFKTYATKMLLRSITPYTQKEARKGYQFIYNSPYLGIGLGVNPAAYDSVKYAYDHWGFFNARNNSGKVTPSVGNYYSGALRDGNQHANENSLSYLILPDGGLVHYEYEANNRLSYSLDRHQISVTGNTAASQNNALLSQVYNNLHQITFQLDNSVSRAGTAPLTGICNLVCNVKSTDGTVLYATDTVSLYDLFYQGLKTWQFNVTNGTYRIETLKTGSGTITAGSFPFSVAWENKINPAFGFPSAGGIRIKKVTTRNADDTTGNQAIVEEYKYLLENGNSSGFLGDTVRYDYQYQQTVTSSSVTTPFTVINSDPITATNYMQGSTVGYSRVEVYKGSQTHNLGKTVYEFTGLGDVNANSYTPVFPYAPQDIKEWGLGLPKRISVFDSTGKLVKRTVNQYVFNVLAYNTSDFKSLKLGRIAASFTNDPITFPGNTPTSNTFIGQEYYPSSGWVSLSNTNDTLFNANNSITTSAQTFQYDANYQVSKVITSYNRSRNLNLETRLYYPYNYTITGAIGKLRDSGILSPVISTEKWITGDGNERIVSGTINDFQQLASGQIVPLASYALQTNKPLPTATITAFNAASLNRNATYFVKQINIPSYDGDGNPLQTTNAVSGQSASTIMDYSNKYPIAKVSNALKADIAYTSFESDGTGYWTIPSTTRDKTQSITGKCSYNLSNGSVSKSGLSSTTTYIMSLWAPTATIASCNGQSIQIYAQRSNGWGLYIATVTGVTTVTIAGSGVIDELRLHPKDANMVTYTYEPNVGITTTCDANNTIIYTEYDNLNRVKLLRDFDRNILKRINYSDSIFSADTTSNWVGTGKACRGDGTASYDSIYTNMAVYSDTYLKTKNIRQGYDCNCPNSTPSLYKTINGVCELGQRVNTDTYQIKINGVWKWRCVYHYEWSDGSRTADTYEDGGSSACTLGGGGAN